jgi:alginate O-acetyltransferase complex protein AlgI
MRPLRSFFLLLIFLACFTGLHYIIHNDHLFPEITEFVPDSLLPVPNPQEKQTEEIIQPPSESIIADTANAIKETLMTAQPVPSHSSFLGGFYDSLENSKGQVRIIYYGDSQIEGDRITSYLRHELRKKHGGAGPGLLLPLMPVMYTKSTSLRSSSNWKRYNYLSYKSGEISHNNFGPFMTMCRYLPEGEIKDNPEKAYVKIRPSDFADSSSSEYNNLRIFYGNTFGTVNIRIKGDDQELYSDTLRKGEGYFEIDCPLKRQKNILIEFSGRVSPDIYGLSIESETGVIVDNIPQRGSAGLEFTMVGTDNLRESFRKLSPDLIILHYGLNIVKNIRNNYYYYQKGLSRQIALLKSISPSTPILVIGVTDMALNEGDSIISYNNIPSIIKAQKLATMNSRETFWDSYKAMGGKASIVRWSAKNPPLAQKDFVHFTYPGADSLSKILVAALFSHTVDSVHRHDTSAIKPIADLATSSVDSSALNREDTSYHIRPDTSVISTTSTPGNISASYESTKGPESRLNIIWNSLLNYNPASPFLFTSAAFWLFFLIVLLGYSVVYKKLMVRNVYLFLVSLFFYYKAGGLFLLILIFVTVIDYTCGYLIYVSRRPSSRKLFLLLSIISNLGLLGYFKYTGFFIRLINEFAGTNFRVYDLLSDISNSFLGTSFDISYILLPVGISFFTFQSLSYTIDVYRKKMKAVRNIIDFGFYVSFFPHLVAGPIVRASVFIPQIYQEFRLSKHEFSHAIYMISKGLIKKIIISNFLALYLVDRIFDAPAVYSGFENLMAVYGYGLQIYCDFSGYTDIAIGVALILGFRLPVNFNSPYKARSVTDFWKRWHISLSQWLRDYLYISLGGNRKGKIRTYINLMITMLLGGLWHGASLRYVIWGGLHGIGLVFNRIWDSLFGEHSITSRAGRAISIFITFQFVNFCWIFFRAPDMESIKVMLKQIFGSFSPGSYMTVLPAYSSALMVMALGYVIHFLPEKTKESYRGLFIRIPIAAQLAIVMGIAVLLFQMRTTEVMPFIYFRF